MSYDVAKRRAALAAFFQSTGLKEYPIERAAGIGQGTIRAFRIGRSASMTDESWTRIAVAATEKLGRLVTAAELQGEAKSATVPITSRVGAGEQVFPIDGDLPLGYVEAPAGVSTREAFQVDGDSMRPLYGPRDLLFPGRHQRDPASLIGRIVVAQVRNGPRAVKLLQRGSRKGSWNLVSVNPAHAMMEDQTLDWVAMIAAAIYAPP